MTQRKHNPRRFLMPLAALVVAGFIAWRLSPEDSGSAASVPDAAQTEVFQGTPRASRQPPEPPTIVPHFETIPDREPPTLTGHPRGLTLAEQDEHREPERIEDVPAEVIEHARTVGFAFEGTVVRAVEEHGFWIIDHPPIDAYMWASERRPIHPESPDQLLDYGPGDAIRGTIFHGEAGYVLRPSR